MLKASNTSVEAALRLFNGAGITTGLLVPTKTGYHKSIMDATLSFRDFLLETGTHNYSRQNQGQSNKVFIPAKFVLPDRCISSEASLYRPNTKQGDPRIWFSKLTHYCKPTDLLAVVSFGGVLYVFNMSDHGVVEAFGMPGSYPHDILSDCSEVISPVAQELLGKLKKIHALGFVKGIVPGDTNIGMTLEHLLGVSPNSLKTPDYKGIELKSSRIAARQRVSNAKRVTLFANTPDWKRSKFSAVEILKHFGYSGEHGDCQLYCTVDNKPNAQGLFLDASNEIDLVNRAKTEVYTGEVAVWALETLKTRLAEKHKETFWVQAVSKVCDGKEYFQYDLVKHTRKPNTSNLGSMFDAGIITLDYAMYLRPSGSVRDHGYLFRTTREKMKHIFPLERIYDLGA